MARHSSTLAWRIPGTGDPGGLPSMGSHRVGHNWSDLAAAAAAAYILSCHLCIVTILPLSDQFEILLIYFYFLTALPRIPVLCWIEVVRMGITVLFQNLVGRLSTFYHWVLCWLWVCHSSFLLCWNRSLSAHFGESFYHEISVFWKSKLIKSWPTFGHTVQRLAHVLSDFGSFRNVWVHDACSVMSDSLRLHRLYSPPGSSGPWDLQARIL